jgi:hypothetical protein
MVKSPSFVDQVPRPGIYVFCDLAVAALHFASSSTKSLGFSRMLSLTSTTRSLEQSLYIDLIVLKVPITFPKVGDSREGLCQQRRKPFHRTITFPAEHSFSLAPLQLSSCQPSQELEQSTAHPTADSRVMALSMAYQMAKTTACRT